MEDDKKSIQDRIKEWKGEVEDMGIEPSGVSTYVQSEKTKFIAAKAKCEQEKEDREKAHELELSKLEIEKAKLNAELEKADKDRAAELEKVDKDRAADREKAERADSLEREYMTFEVRQRQLDIDSRAVRDVEGNGSEAVSKKRLAHIHRACYRES
jgi:hypothetical protein